MLCAGAAIAISEDKNPTRSDKVFDHFKSEPGWVGRGAVGVPTRSASLAPPPGLLHGNGHIEHTQCQGTKGANSSHQEVGANVDLKAVLFLGGIGLPILDCVIKETSVTYGTQFIIIESWVGKEVKNNKWARK